MDNKFNIFFAVLFSVLIIGAWNFFFPPFPEVPPVSQTPDSADTAPLTKNIVIVPRAEAITESDRITIDSETLAGSINLKGLRFDDITLLKYYTTLEKTANVELLSPSNSPNGYIVQFGWLSSNPATEVPNAQTIWRANKSSLKAGDTILFTTTVGKINYQVEVALDKQYLFTITQRARNFGAGNEDMSFYGLTAKFGEYNPSRGNPIVAEGGVMNVNDDFFSRKYQALTKDFNKGKLERNPLTGDKGWLGFSDKYWLVALSPQLQFHGDTNTNKTVPAKNFTATLGYDTIQNGNEGLGRYQADYTTDREILIKNGQIEKTTYLFTGPKDASLLSYYRDNKAIDKFDLAIDYGRLYILTKPMAWLLNYLTLKLHSVGLAILALTVLVRLLLYPLAQKAFQSMAKMKKVSPQVNELKKRYGDDKAQMSQAMMALYKKEKVNPLAGCLPMLVQIPVFFALYRVFIIAIEFRHASFFGWVHDLSAPDPAGILILFGFAPWSVPPILSILNIGIWPILMGITLFLQQKLNPPVPDPIQAKIFGMFPYIFTFVLGQSPVGVVIYWAWSNVLSILQQYIINRRLGIEGGPSFKNILQHRKNKKIPS